MPTYIAGDLLEAKVDFIIQQCNCLTIRGLGLSKAIATKFPYADIYSKRTPQFRHGNIATESSRSIPGTFTLCTSEEKNLPGIVCIFGQWKPGKIDPRYPNYYNNILESDEQRLKWFTIALYSFGDYIRKNNLLMATKYIIGVPFKIGCGLAGGRWNDYQKTLEKFEQDFRDILSLQIYKL